jgi:hypothetical protein
LCGLVEASILDCRSSGDGQQFGTPQILLCISVRIGVAGGKKSQEFFGCDQRHAQPGSKLFVSLEGLPPLFLVRVRDQYAFLVLRYPLQERRFVSNQSQRGSKRFVCGLGTELFTQRQPVGTTFRNQDPRTGVRNQLCKGSQQRIQNEIHAQVLGKRQGGFTQCIGFGPGRFGFGKVFSHLVLRLFLGGDFLCSPYKAENLTGTVSYRESMHLDPPHFAMGTEDAEPFIESSNWPV